MVMHKVNTQNIEGQAILSAKKEKLATCWVFNITRIERPETWSDNTNFVQIEIGLDIGL